MLTSVNIVGMVLIKMNAYDAPGQSTTSRALSRILPATVVNHED